MATPLLILMFEHKDNLRGAIQIYQAPTYDVLVQKVVEGRRKLGKPSNYNAVYNELNRKKAGQSRNDNQVVRGGTGRGSQCPKVFHTPDEVYKGAIAHLKNILGITVDQTEINRRAAICQNCPHTCGIAGCSRGCGLGKAAVALWDKTMKFFGGKRYEVPAALKRTYCGVCGCSHGVILAARLEDFHPDSPEKANKRPDNCWLKNR